MHGKIALPNSDVDQLEMLTKKELSWFRGGMSSTTKPAGTCWCSSKTGWCYLMDANGNFLDDGCPSKCC